MAIACCKGKTEGLKQSVSSDESFELIPVPGSKKRKRKMKDIKFNPQNQVQEMPAFLQKGEHLLEMVADGNCLFYALSFV